MTPAAWILIAAAAGSFGLAIVLTAAALRVAPALGYVDRPGGHKSHHNPTPYGGGVAILLAAWVPAGLLLLAVQFVPAGWLEARFGPLLAAYAGGVHDRSGSTGLLLLGGLILHIMGLYDDRRPLGPLVKFAVMTAVALLTALGAGVRIAEFLSPAASIAVTVLWILVIVNAFNFLDNMDGLSAGVAVICLGYFAAAGLAAGQVLVPALAALLLGAVGGFLFWNFPPARIFMGDAGSLLTGYGVAVISILTTYYESGAGAPPFPLAIPLVILAIPLYDFCSVVLIRLRERRNLLRGDQRHFSHRLVDHGFTRRTAVLTIYVATMATGLGATLLPSADLRATITILALVSLILLLIAILESPVRREP